MSVLDFIKNTHYLNAVESTILKEMLAEAWRRLCSSKITNVEDYHAWMVVILRLEKELGNKCFP